MQLLAGLNAKADALSLQRASRRHRLASYTAAVVGNLLSAASSRSSYIISVPCLAPVSESLLVMCSVITAAIESADATKGANSMRPGCIAKGANITSSSDETVHRTDSQTPAVCSGMLSASLVVQHVLSALQARMLQFCAAGKREAEGCNALLTDISVAAADISW
jgi:hypothetical protein